MWRLSSLDVNGFHALTLSQQSVVKCNQSFGLLQNLLYRIILVFSYKKQPENMKYSLLLTGLVQRLLLVCGVLALVWGVYFWAIQDVGA